MKPVLTAEEYRRVDKAYGGDLGEAMGRAGHAVALAATRLGAGYGRTICVLAGPGNNGGDGYLAASFLQARGAAVRVLALAEPKTALCRAAARQAASNGVSISKMGAPEPCDVVIDAVFGGGVRGGLPAEVMAWMGTEAPVVAVDYPTGLDPDTGQVEEAAFVASETVTFSTLKTGHVRGVGPEHCGRITIADIGIEGGAPSMYIAEESDAHRPRRERTTHKWRAGAVLVVGGSPGMVGASILAGRAALEFGAGTVYLATTQVDLSQRVAPDLPALEIDSALDQLARFDVVVAGPGLSPDTATPLTPILEKAGNLVLDAGALTPKSLEAARVNDAEVVITPHDAEFVRVAGIGVGSYSVRSFARKMGLTVLRKGSPTMISDGGLPVLVNTGGPELASIGTGDVLAGMIGALWSRGLTPPDAAISAAYWHGVAGAGLARSRSVTAERLVGEIGRYAW